MVNKLNLQQPELRQASTDSFDYNEDKESFLEIAPVH
jgi:hypothetical protein